MQARAPESVKAGGIHLIVVTIAKRIDVHELAVLRHEHPTRAQIRMCRRRNWQNESWRRSRVIPHWTALILGVG